MTAEAAIEATPITAAALFPIRVPNSASTVKLANGTAGISQISPNTSTPHLAGSVGVQRFVLVIQLQKQRQTDRHFSCRCGQDKNEHHLAVGLSPAGSGGYKGQACGVQHDLNRHQNEDQVTPHEKARQSQCEQDPGQQQSVFDRYR